MHINILRAGTLVGATLNLGHLRCWGYDMVYTAVMDTHPNATGYGKATEQLQGRAGHQGRMFSLIRTAVYELSVYWDNLCDTQE